MILHLFIDGHDFIAASNDRESLRSIGDKWIDCGLSSGYQIVPLDYLIECAYVV